MGLVEIKTFQELLKFLPALVLLFKDLDGLWEPDMTPKEFVATLSNNFQKNTKCYGIQINSEIAYFIAVQELTSTKACFWLFYMNVNKRLYTRNLLNTLKSTYAQRGFRQVEFTTTRITPSYERWVEKFGATKHSITYKLEIK